MSNQAHITSVREDRKIINFKKVYNHTATDQFSYIFRFPLAYLRERLVLEKGNWGH